LTWVVVETTYPGGFYWTYIPPPDAGDSAFIIDSDSAGAGVTVVDTAMSPVVGNSGFDWLKWGFYLEEDDLQVLLREWDASWGSWNVIASYSGTTGPAWDSVDVSSYTGDSVQVAFSYDDGGGWWYGASFDNVQFITVSGTNEEMPDDVTYSTLGFANMANPVTDFSVLSYTIPFSGKVSLKVYDGTGRLVTTLVDEVQPAGVKTIHWNSQSLSSGVYFFRLVANGDIATHKSILIK